MYVYNLYYSGWDTYSPNMFSHEKCFSEEEFKSICDSLLSEAVRLAIGEKPRTFVGWEEIVRHVAALLPKHGFTPYRPVACGYLGPVIIDSANRDSEDNSALPEEVADLVVSHNDRLNEELLKDFKDEITERRRRHERDETV